MEQSLDFFANCFSTLVSLLNGYVFTIYNMRVTLLDIFISCIILSMCVTLYWKGAKG